MAYAAHHSHLAHCSTQEASLQSNTNGKKPGVLWRIFDAIVESRQKSINRKSPSGSPDRAGASRTVSEREITQSL